LKLNVVRLKACYSLPEEELGMSCHLSDDLDEMTVLRAEFVSFETCCRPPKGALFVGSYLPDEKLGMSCHLPDELDGMTVTRGVRFV
jgi:hypothetical protein